MAKTVEHHKPSKMYIVVNGTTRMQQFARRNSARKQAKKR